MGKSIKDDDDDDDNLPSGPRVEIKPRQLLARILDILLRLHAHVKNGTIFTRTNDLVVQTALAPLTLRPQPAEADFQLADFGQRLGVQFARPGPAVGADGAAHFFLADEGFLAAHARLRLFGKLHESAEGGRRDGDGARVFAREELAGFFAEDRFEDPAEWFGELVVEVIFGIDGDVVFEDEDGIFASLVVLGAAGTLDDYVGDTVAEGGSGAGVSLLHSVGKFDVGLFAGVVGFGEGFCDDEFGHVDFVLEEVGDGVFDIARRRGNYGQQVYVKGRTAAIHTLARPADLGR